MAKYTTGEVAKLCGVSVRTVQYYDNRNLLVPSELTEGGRRLYSEEDLKMMKIICFLREAGLPINSINALLEDENPESVISILLGQQEQTLKEEIAERQKQLDMLDTIRKEMKNMESFSVESIGDIVHIMKNKKALTRVRTILIVSGVPISVFEFVSIALWILYGWWLPFVIWAVVGTIGGVLISKYYFDKVAYICPDCHEVFKPKLKEMLWARHTPKMRYLKCPNCERSGFCIEVYADKDDLKKEEK